jgi:hypothetical protein
MGTERQELTICNGQLKWAPYLPSVTTSSPVSSITQTTAIVSGNVTNDGCGSVTRGICYSTSPNPTIANTVVNSGQGTGSFQATLSNLSSATTYYVKAFATNGAGTTYGNQVTFQTSIVTLPALYLDSVSFTRNYSDSINLFSFYQYFNGNLTSAGGSATTTGFVWSTSTNPNLSNSFVTYGTLFGPSDFTSNAEIDFYDWYYSNNQTPIIYPNTTYYIRAFATNSAGTTYSNQLIIQTEAGAEGTTGPAGGKIVYDRGEYINGWRYLEIATSDISSAAAWGCSDTYINTDSYEGSGLNNTNTIIAACATSGIAAALCANYSQNGTSDWFLPSISEFSFFFFAANYLPTITDITGNYWTSTTSTSIIYSNPINYAISITANGTSNSGEVQSLRSDMLKVRAMRKF